MDGSKITATWDTLPNGSFFFEMHKFDVEGGRRGRNDVAVEGQFLDDPKMFWHASQTSVAAR